MVKILSIIFSPILLFLLKARIGNKIKFIIISALVVFWYFFFSHQIPVFHNIEIFKNIKISHQSQPYSLYFNFEKPFVSFFLLILFGKWINFKFSFFRNIKTIFFSYIFLFLILLLPAILSGMTFFEPKVSSVWTIWMAVNLFTCLVEEIIYRGFLQKYFEQILTGMQAIVITSLIFGAHHIPNMGVTFSCLAFLAGLGYGYAYHTTGSILASTLVHFLINATHFFLFVYPMVKM